jgi:type I restriction enzyme R subunit
VQLGLTATPKRKHNADTYAYFGEPVYVYALKEGIEDGFLTPFKVRQMASTIDDYVYDGRRRCSSRARSRSARPSPRRLQHRIIEIMERER